MAEAMTLSIGLFCMESYNYEQLIKNYLTSKGIDPTTLTKVGIKKGRFIAKSGEVEVFSVPLKEIDQFVRGSCHRCDDFTAEYADISVGGVGCPDGYSTVIARTQNGLEVLTGASQAGFVELQELKQEDKGFRTILKMSQLKKQKNHPQK